MLIHADLQLSPFKANDSAKPGFPDNGENLKSSVDLKSKVHLLHFMAIYRSIRLHTLQSTDLNKLNCD